MEYPTSFAFGLLANVIFAGLDLTRTVGWQHGALESARTVRYAGWDAPAARKMLQDGTLESISDRVMAEGINPKPRSGRQERLENLWNRFV